MNRIKRALTLLLVFLLTVSGALVPKTVAFAETSKGEQAAIEKFLADNQEKKLDVDLSEAFAENDDVRIIVELKANPGIEIANEKNVSYSKLSVSETKKIESNIKANQDTVKKQISSRSIKMEYKNSFSVTFNGFSGIVKYKDIQVIEKLDTVKKVYIANEYEKPEVTTDMLSSGGLVYVNETWALDFKGEGQVVAIIDTGIDSSHRDMVLSEETIPALDSTEVAGLGLKGKYYTEKVPYGYNYYDLNSEIKDLGPDASMHGMHVAGTAGANGDTANGGIKGIAPEAQLLAMKVFSNDPIYATTFTDIYLVAIDDAIKLGADVINMSLGSTAGFYVPESPEALALANALENGVISSVSAGNSGTVTYGWTKSNYGYPYAQNPDVGVVGSPGLNAATISVASIENTKQMVNYLSYLNASNETVKAVYAKAGPTDPIKAFTGETEYVYAGLGTVSAVAAVNLTGKIALIMRGSISFVDKIQNAYNGGAIGVIVFNSASGGETLINMAYPGGLTIPAVFVGNSAGVALNALAVKKISFPSGYISVTNPNAGKMSAFSSWGTTPSLEIKPEITAPGGQIFSTLNNNTYGLMSGTSMAAPHVAGGSALVTEYLKETSAYSGLSDAELAKMAKVLMMNTAIPAFDAYGVEISPRSQGAGVMNLYGAVTTPVRLVNSLTKEAKVELKDFTGTTFTMKLTAYSTAAENLTYTVETTLLQDYIEAVAGNDLNVLVSDYIDAAVITAPETVMVPANGSVSFDVVVDISGDADVYENMFVEGFVKLVETTDTHPDVAVPFVGFYGEWDEPAIVDGLSYSSAFGKTYFDFSGFLYLYEDEYYFNEGETLYMNPGTWAGDTFGSGATTPILSFLRNADDVNYRILDKDGNVLRNIATEHFVTKNFINGGSKSAYSIKEIGTWDGTIDGMVPADGDYFYEVYAKIGYEGAQYQSFKQPIEIDTVGPEITNAKIDAATGMLTFDAVDLGAGLNMFQFELNGAFLPLTVNAIEGVTSYEVDLSDYLTGTDELVIYGYDNIYNESTATVYSPSDADPYIFITSPELLVIYDTNTVAVEGYVTNVNFLDKVMIDDSVEATLEYLDHVDLKHPDDPATVLINGPAYHFTAEVELADGYHEMQIKAISKSGSEGSLTRRFYTDTTAPTLKATILTRDPNSATATIKLDMADNLGYLKLMEGDSQVYLYDQFEEQVIIGPASKSFESKVNLVNGENKFTYILYDAANHTTMIEVIVYKGAQPTHVERIFGNTRYTTAIEVSKAQFDSATEVVIANGENYPDALAGAALAKKLNAPVLLVTAKAVSTATMNELKRLGTANVHILGGTLVVSTEVEDVLRGLGYHTTRYMGINRFATAVKIGEKVMAGSSVDTVVLTNGYEYQDTLSANAYAAKEMFPVLFSKSDALNEYTKQAFINWGIKNVKVIGSKASISDAVIDELMILGISVERISATNRELMSLEVAKKFFPTAKKAIIASGYNFPDALVGGSFAASMDAPILLVNTNSIDAAVLAYLKANFDSVVILGGPDAVTVAVEAKIIDALK